MGLSAVVAVMSSLQVLAALATVPVPVHSAVPIFLLRLVVVVFLAVIAALLGVGVRRPGPKA